MIQDEQLSVTGEGMCTKYWLTAKEARKGVVSSTGRPDMTIAVYRGRKTTQRQQQQ